MCISQQISVLQQMIDLEDVRLDSSLPLNAKEGVVVVGHLQPLMRNSKVETRFRISVQLPVEMEHHFSQATYIFMAIEIYKKTRLLQPLALAQLLHRFSSYRCGVFCFDRATDSIRDSTHAVEIVDYGTTSSGIDFWVVKNS